MDWQQLFINAYGRVTQVLEQATEGLTVEELNTQVRPDCNSIGWVAWHLTRVQDRAMADLSGEEQLWIKDGWHLKFNRPPDGKDTGFGHASEDVAGYKSPDVPTLMAYHHAVAERSKQYLSSLSETDLDREFDNPRSPTYGARLVAVISDNLQHVGQVAYVRGVVQGKGWLNV